MIVARLHQQVYRLQSGLSAREHGAALAAEEMRFQCPRHGSKYQPDGTFISGRATRNMDRFAVQRSGDTMLVDISQLSRSDEQAAAVDRRGRYRSEPEPTLASPTETQ